MRHPLSFEFVAAFKRIDFACAMTFQDGVGGVAIPPLDSRSVWKPVTHRLKLCTSLSYSPWSAYCLLNTLPITILLTSLVPAPIS